MEEKSRKCIAVFTAKADKTYQADILKGIYKVAFENDMNVAVFTSTVAAGTEENINSELKIFTLANPDKFCGVIYLPDTFDFADMTELIDKPLVKAHTEKGFPTVTIDGNIKGLPSLHSDESEGIKTLVEHFVKHHKCKDIAFMTGRKGHPHAERRLEAFLEYMSQNNLSVPQSRIFYGDFWYDKGDDFVDQLLNSNEGLPEAIICANEYMAHSVYHALFQRGFSVPNDVIVSCFTGEPKEMKFITSVWKNSENLGIKACQTIIDMLNGKKIAPTEHFVKCDYPLNPSVTCDCLKTYGYDFTTQYNKSVFETDNYFSEYNSLNECLLTCKSMGLMFWSADWFTYYIKGFKGIYFVMCKDWEDPINSPINSGNYTDQMEIYYYREEKGEGIEPDKAVGHGRFFDTADVFPKLFSAEGEPSSFIIRSLHFFGKCLGYVILNNGTAMRTYDIIFNFWIKDVVKAIESQLALQKAEYLYSTDVMTGIFNRNAFNIKPYELLENYKQTDKNLAIIVYDMDGLKHINDTYGHTEGDFAIKNVARIISNTTVENADEQLDFRIGGDEFVKIVVGDFTKADLDLAEKKLHQMISQFNHTSQKPYKVHTSIGVCTKKVSEISTVSEILSIADNHMYENKLKFKSK